MSDDSPAVLPADPDAPCYHEHVETSIDVARLGDGDDSNPTPGMPRHFMIELRARCARCGERFRFEGVPAGLSFAAPATSVDGFELRAPIRPEQAPPAFPRRGEPAGFAVAPRRPRGGRRPR